jgi:hypothetical protein
MGAISIALLAGWFLGPTALKRIEGFFADRTSMTQGSPQLATDAMARLSGFREREEGSVLSFNADEVASLLIHSDSARLLERTADSARLLERTAGLSIKMEEGKIKISSRVSTSDFPQLLHQEGIPDFLPDTVSISVEGAIVPLISEEIGLAVYSAQVSFIPLPSVMIPALLEVFSVEMENGYPGAVIKLPFLRDISGAFILHDRLFLLR